VRGDRLTASQILIDKVTEPRSPIHIRYRTAVQAFEGANSRLKTVQVLDVSTGQTDVLSTAAAFIFIGQEPNSLFTQGHLELDDYGYILTGHDLEHSRAGHPNRERHAFETSVSGVFAAGDVRHGSTKQVASAVGEGAAVAIAIRQYLKST
jgi:thioredoxin reductase (NADPH)